MHAQASLVGWSEFGRRQGFVVPMCSGGQPAALPADQVMICDVPPRVIVSEGFDRIRFLIALGSTPASEWLLPCTTSGGLPYAPGRVVAGQREEGGAAGAAIVGVPKQRVADVLRVHPDLVGAPGGQVPLHQRHIGVRKRLQQLEAAFCIAAPAPQRRACLCSRTTSASTAARAVRGQCARGIWALCSGMNPISPHDVKGPRD
jgi:hypothetical protein